MKSCRAPLRRKRLPEDHYRHRIGIFSMIKKLFLAEIQIARQDWEFLVQEAESAGERLSEGEMKKILLSKLTPEMKAELFALNGAFCGRLGWGERLLRAKLFRRGAEAGNQVQSRLSTAARVLFSSAQSQ